MSTTGKVRRAQRLLAAGATLIALSGCSDDDPARRDAVDVGDVDGGSGPYVFPQAAPEGWELRTLELPDESGFRRGLLPGGVSVFTADGDVEVFASRRPGPPWPEDEVVAPLDVDATDGRAVYAHPYEQGHLVVDVYGSFVVVWGEEAAPAVIQRFAAVVDPYGSRPTEPYRHVATIPEAWASSGTAVDVTLATPDRTERITTVSLPAREIDALRLLLLDDPARALRTAPSMYDLERYPRPEEVGDGALFGMLDSSTSALVLEGDPGVVILADSYDADDANRDRDLLASVVPLLRRGDTEDLREVAADAIAGRLDSERDRLTVDRPVHWTRLEGGRLRLFVTDSSPAFSGPDTDETRGLHAPCLVVILHTDAVSGHDGCADPREEVVAVGEVRTDTSQLTPERHVFALADDDVVTVQLRAGDDVYTQAERIDLDEDVAGRSRLFLLTYGTEPWVLRRDLEVVALDADGDVLRRVQQNRIGTFEAQPARGIDR